MYISRLININIHNDQIIHELCDQIQMLNSQLMYYKTKFGEPKVKNSVEILKDITNCSRLNPEIDIFDHEEELKQQDTSRFAKESSRSEFKTKFGSLEQTITFGSDEQFNCEQDPLLISERSEDRVDTQTGDEMYGCISNSTFQSKLHKRASSYYIPSKNYNIQHIAICTDPYSILDSSNKKYRLSDYTDSYIESKENIESCKSRTFIFNESNVDESEEVSTINLVDNDDKAIKMPRNFILPSVINSKHNYQTESIDFNCVADAKIDTEESSDNCVSKVFKNLITKLSNSFSYFQSPPQCKLTSEKANSRYRARRWMNAFTEKSKRRRSLVYQSKYNMRRKFSNYYSKLRRELK